ETRNRHPAVAELAVARLCDEPLAQEDVLPALRRLADPFVGINRGLELLSAVRSSAFAPLFAKAEDVVRTSFILPLRHLRTRVKVDLAIGLTRFERPLISRAWQEDRGRFSCAIAAAEDLLIMKVLAGRPRDTEDARTITIKQGSRLDW